jgi:hypothetical protein
LFGCSASLREPFGGHAASYVPSFWQNEFDFHEWKQGREQSYEAMRPHEAAPQLAPISDLTSARSASIETRPLGVSTCQKAQPLQASRPCASAPMR